MLYMPILYRDLTRYAGVYCNICIKLQIYRRPAKAASPAAFAIYGVFSFTTVIDS